MVHINFKILVMVDTKLYIFIDPQEIKMIFTVFLLCGGYLLGGVW